MVKKKRRRAPNVQRKPQAGWTITGWCEYRGISKSVYYLWKKEGRAPALLQPAGHGGWAIITPAADAAWAARFGQG
jgi:hypothetical protein